MARKQKGWTEARLQKFRATMAAKKGSTTTGIPLDAIPARAPKKATAISTATPLRLQLALELVRLLAQLLR